MKSSLKNEYEYIKFDLKLFEVFPAGQKVGIDYPKNVTIFDEDSDAAMNEFLDLFPENIGYQFGDLYEDEEIIELVNAKNDNVIAVYTMKF